MKYNVYLSNFTIDKVTFLIELLDYNQEYLKTHYYSVIFSKSKETNKFEVSRIIEIGEILPYLESTYKDKNVKKYKVDNDTSRNVIKLIYDAIITKKVTVKDELLKTSNIKIYNNFMDNFKNHSYKLCKESKIYDETEKRKKTYEDLYEEYINNKKDIKKYLISKKGSK